jgi:hypothetical protein
MLNPIVDLVTEFKTMNAGITERLDKIIELLNALIDIELENDNG